MPIASRLLSAGTLLVNGSFDENTSIAPTKFRTTADTVYAEALDEVSLPTGTIFFNGTISYLIFGHPTSTGFFPGLSNTWTVELWGYLNSGGFPATMVSFNSGGLAVDPGGINLWKDSAGRLRADNGIDESSPPMGAAIFNPGQWTHIAFVKNGATNETSGYVNGVLAGTTSFTQMNTFTIQVGRSGAAGYYFPGYISNLRMVDGVRVYTSEFTPPQAILPAVPGTVLLLNVTNSANFLKDNSTNNYKVTNIATSFFSSNGFGPFSKGSSRTAQRQLPDGTLQVFNQFDEFTGAPVVDTSLQLWLDAGQTSSYAGSGATWTDLSGVGNNGTLVNGPTFSSTIGGGALVFNGTNQYITSSFATTSGQAVTYCGWLYSTESTATYRNFVDSDIDSVSTNPMIWWNTSGQVEFDDAAYTTTTVYRNQWVHVALSKPSGSSSASYYVNGDLVGTGTAYTIPAVTPTWLNRATAQTWLGGCSMVQAYNRALSADEIATNFNALRGRYGI